MTGLEKRLIEETRDLIASTGLKAKPSRRVKSPDEPVDASLQIALSADEMTATATFYPPRGTGEALSTDTVYELLAAVGVVHGIDRDGLETAVYTCNTERSALYSVEVARGTAPSDAIHERLELVPRQEEAPVDEKGRLDHRSRTTLPLVKAGDVLARVIPASPGRRGTTVTGTELPYRTRRTAGLLPGSNTALEDGELRAVVDGLMHVDGRTVTVAPTLVVEGNVDYHTGNIVFDGDVVLQRRVSDGFTIECGGMLYAASTLDAYGVSCAKLVARQGIIGHNDSVTRVDGPVTARFVQNSRLEAEGAVSISASVLSSHLTSADQIELGPGSTVVGSTLRAQAGINACNIGAPGAAATEIVLGIDFRVDARLATIRDQTVALTEKLTQVRLALRHGARNRQSLEKLESGLEAAIATLTNEAGELVSRLDRHDEAQLLVRGTVHEGTYVEICHRSYLVERTASRCRFRIDKSRGVVTMESLANARERGTDG